MGGPKVAVKDNVGAGVLGGSALPKGAGLPMAGDTVKEATLKKANAGEKKLAEANVKVAKAVEVKSEEVPLKAFDPDNFPNGRKFVINDVMFEVCRVNDAATKVTFRRSKPEK